MRVEVGEAAAQGVQVLGVRVLHRDPAVVLERPVRGHDHGRVGAEAGEPALDVEELLRAEVGGEARLGQADLAELQRHAGGHHRVAPVRDVGEGPAVDEGGRALHGLHEVGMDGVAEQRGHGPRHPEGVRGHRLAVAGERHHHAPQPGPEVGEILGEAQHGHDLGRGGDEEAALARHPVHAPAEADDEAPQRAVVHVEGPLPQHLAHVDAERVAVVEVIVQGGGEQVVGGGDGVKVAGEVQVDLVHGHDLRAAAAGAAALEAERGADRRLAERDHRTRARLPEGLAEADGHGGLAVAGRRGRDGGDHHELAVGSLPPRVERVEAAPWPWSARRAPTPLSARPRSAATAAMGAAER